MRQGLVPSERIEERIFLIRGKRVMLDSDLAKLYGVTTKALLQAVRRNVLRFPSDFMYLIARDEFLNLRSQIVTSSYGYGGRRTYPYAFTQEGVAMLSSVLRSKRAILVNIQIMRAFVKLRELMLTHKDLAQRIEALEKQYKGHDERFKVVFEAIRKLLQYSEEENVKKEPIGFRSVKTDMPAGKLKPVKDLLPAPKRLVM